MFEKYEVLAGGTTSNKISLINIEIIDSDFTAVVEVEMTKDGIDIMTPLIALYEQKGKNVAANVAKAYVYLSHRFSVEPKVFLERMIKVNKSVGRYKDQIEKYLSLI